MRARVRCVVGAWFNGEDIMENRWFAYSLALANAEDALAATATAATMRHGLRRMRAELTSLLSLLSPESMAV